MKKVMMLHSVNHNMYGKRDPEQYGTITLDEINQLIEKTAKEEGIIFKLLTNPVKIEGEDGWVKSMECVEMELGEPDASGRRRPIAKEGSNFTIETGTVIVAIGQSPNPLIRHTTPGLDCQSWGGIIVDEDSMKTSKDGVYAGGDVVTGAATVILAMGAGKKAAKAMDEYLQNK